ncbi:hypothetical protein E2C01_097931 [Portunus trituberculatus]|uniref:Uncharacterized protein n=1 Tax=Portunus trituberculatus TaxID=210409 RepID=A0A5B7K1M9_PORTR|nr:hypothetical protein [Portunus trituberculatus]
MPRSPPELSDSAAPAHGPVYLREHSSVSCQLLHHVKMGDYTDQAIHASKLMPCDEEEEEEEEEEKRRIYIKKREYDR